MRDGTLQDGAWRVVATLSAAGVDRRGQDPARGRTPPFDALESDLFDLLGLR